jgi:RNA polymerase sigma-70 factor (ECF subfamily)
MAMLVILETFSPDERAVFVLHEGVRVLPHRDRRGRGQEPGRGRQITHRARQHVRSRRLRFTPTGNAVQEVTDRFLAAAAIGDIPALMR